MTKPQGHPGGTDAQPVDEVYPRRGRKRTQPRPEIKVPFGADVLERADRAARLEGLSTRKWVAKEIARLLDERGF